MDIFKNIENFRRDLNISNLIDDEDKELLDTTCDDLISQISDYYCSIFDSEGARLGFKQDSNNLRDYQERVMLFDTKRRNIHNSIITSIVILDRFCLSNGFKPIYGKLTQDELNNSRLVKDSSDRRTRVADDVIKSVGRNL